MMRFEDCLDRLAPLVEDAGPQVDSTLAAGQLGVDLPIRHLQLLSRWNGLTSFHGAFRLFGFRQEPYLDLRSWNAHETWRFAWDDRIEPFLFFGETAWGDQYAYKRSGHDGGLEQEVHLLEAYFLRPEPLADTFEDFLRDEFLRNAETPYDPITPAAVERFGPIDPSQHWVMSPSLALGGDELIENTILLPAITAMIFAGDLATWIEEADDEATPTAVEPWQDAQSRVRLRVHSESPQPTEGGVKAPRTKPKGHESMPFISRPFGADQP